MFSCITFPLKNSCKKILRIYHKQSYSVGKLVDITVILWAEKVDRCICLPLNKNFPLIPLWFWKTTKMDKDFWRKERKQSYLIIKFWVLMVMQNCSKGLSCKYWTPWSAIDALGMKEKIYTDPIFLDTISEIFHVRFF